MTNPPKNNDAAKVIRLGKATSVDGPVIPLTPAALTQHMQSLFAFESAVRQKAPADKPSISSLAAVKASAPKPADGSAPKSGFSLKNATGNVGAAPAAAAEEKAPMANVQAFPSPKKSGPRRPT